MVRSLPGSRPPPRPSPSQLLLRSQELLDFFFQITDPLQIAQNTVFVQQPHRRQARDAKFLGKLLSAIGFVESLRPRDALRRDNLLQSLPLLIVTQSDDLEPLLMKFLVNSLNVRQFAHARAAPGGPKIDQHYFAPQLLEIHFAPIQSR